MRALINQPKESIEEASISGVTTVSEIASLRDPQQSTSEAIQYGGNAYHNPGSRVVYIVDNHER